MNGKRVTRPQLNHLRRLLGWIRCEIGPDAYEQIMTLQKITDAGIVPADKECQERVQDSILKAHSIPRYVRNAIKQLEKVVEDIEDGEVIEGSSELRLAASRHGLRGPANY